MQQLTIENSITLRIYESINELNQKEWDNQLPTIPFYQKFQYLEHLEHTQKQIKFRYIQVYKEQLLLGSIYFQQLDFQMKNIFQYNSNNKIKLLKNYFSKKQIKLLYLGNVYFTGDTGIITENTNKIYDLLPKIFRITDNTFSIKSFAYLVTDIPEISHINLTTDGFQILHTEPDLNFKLNNDWHNFDDYLNSLSSKYRIRSKKILMVSSVIEHKVLSHDEILLYKTDIERLFNNVMDNAQFYISPLNCNFFVNKQDNAENICQIIGYFLENKMVGYINLYSCNKIIHVHYIGLDYQINNNNKLYNRMLLDVVKLGIENRTVSIHFGRTATEIKTTIGAKPSYFRSYVKFSNYFMNILGSYYLKRILPPEFIIRNPFKNKE